MIRRLILAASLAAIVMPTAAQAEFDPECGRDPAQRPIHAEFVQPENGRLTVETSLGTQTLGGTVLPNGVVISTTGTITVTVNHGCVDIMRLVVTKNGTPIHDEVIDTPTCQESSTSRTVSIGLDGGEYVFSLSGTGCNDKPLRESSNGHYVGDPPLPV